MKIMVNQINKKLFHGVHEIIDRQLLNKIHMDVYFFVSDNTRNRRFIEEIMYNCNVIYGKKN